jgi:CRP/FNR family transcriptional regulator, cyclic AMP receptor protein
MNSSTEPRQGSCEYKDNLEIVMHIPIFAGLPLEPLKVLTYFCRRATFMAGDVIFREQDVDPNAYFIIAGTAVLTLESSKESALAEFGEMDFLGALSLFCDRKRLFTLKAKTKVTCLVLPREKFQKTLEQFPEIGRPVFETLAKSICRWESRLITEHAIQCPECRSSIGPTVV